MLILVFFSCKKTSRKTKSYTFKLLPPAKGTIYHNAYPDFDDTEDKVFKDSIKSFEFLAGKEIGWVYFSNNWLPENGGIFFPEKEVQIIHTFHKIPYIRMMPRSGFEEEKPDPLYTMDNFLAGIFDKDLKKWAKKAKACDFPLLVEFGTEMNGSWFPWNGYWNGAGNMSYGNPGEFDGPEKFKEVYRRIITICREEGANNITWFFHVNVENDPITNWNKMKNYYPGDEYIDWIGVSAYGSLEYTEPWRELKTLLTDNWQEISHISSNNKPIALVEWGIYENPSLGNKAKWITDALLSFSQGAVYSNKIKAISYWNEAWEDENDLINLRIDSSPESLQAYKNGIKSSVFISSLHFNE